LAFTGRYRHTIDSKGRLIFPSRLRDELEETKVLLMPSPDPCIAVWCGEARRTYEERLQAQSKASAENRALIRELYSFSHSDEVDKQGRISVPEELRGEMGIDREVVIVGAGDHVEIWDPARYEAERRKVAEVGLSAMFEKLNI
jgi:MraZ protein